MKTKRGKKKKKTEEKDPEWGSDDTHVYIEATNANCAVVTYIQRCLAEVAKREIKPKKKKKTTKEYKKKKNHGR